MSEPSLNTTQRRTFLGIILGAIGAVIAGAFSWPVWRFLAPRSREGELEKIPISRTDIPLEKAYFFSFHGKPAVALQVTPGQFAAFSAVCTHLGCVIKWVPDRQEFLCPCHAGRFSVEGKVLGGPPPQPLEVLPVSLAGDQVLIG